MRFINYFLILLIVANSIQCVRIRRNRKFGKPFDHVNRTAAETNVALPLYISEVKIENVTEIFVTQNPDTSSITQKDIESHVDNFKSSKYENFTKEVPIYSVRPFSERARIINIEVERHTELVNLELECKFGNVSD